MFKVLKCLKIKLGFWDILHDYILMEIMDKFIGGTSKIPLIYFPLADNLHLIPFT